MRLFKFIIICSIYLFGIVGLVDASEYGRYYEGIIIEELAVGTEQAFEERVNYQDIVVEITGGERAGEIIEVHNSADPMYLGSRKYEKFSVGDKLTMTSIENIEGQEVFYINGKLRRPGLVSLTIIFIVVVLVVGRLWGALSLVGLLISFVVIFKLIVPMIMNGSNPVWAAILGSVIIIPATFYVSHGFNKKTHVGVVSTLLVLLFTGLLAVSFVNRVHLIGLASEEAGFLDVELNGGIDLKNLLIAGMIIGVLGILDDVTVGQASVVQQLKKADKNSGFRKLFLGGMKVGQDHISSMVNTLVLVYSGSALPLILLFFDSQRGWVETLEMEVIAEEVVRMLVGSIGLVVAAPIATALAAWFFSGEREKEIFRTEK